MCKEMEPAHTWTRMYSSAVIDTKVQSSAATTDARRLQSGLSSASSPKVCKGPSCGGKEGEFRRSLGALCEAACRLWLTTATVLTTKLDDAGI